MGFFDEVKNNMNTLNDNSSHKTATKKEKNKANTLVVILITLMSFGIYYLLSDNDALEVKKQATIAKVEPVMDIQKKENDYNTPENYLLDFYNYQNAKNWKDLTQISLKRYSEEELKNILQYRTVVGLKINKIEKPSKILALAHCTITYKEVTNKVVTKNITARLELATNFVDWIVSPLTTF